MQNLPLPFQPTAGLFIWTLVVFLLLLVVLSKFIFPTLVKMTADREAAIAKQLAEAAQMRAEAATALEEHRQALARARTEAQAIVAEARQAAERERTLGVEKTHREQEELLSRARREIADERERALSSIRRETVDLAIAAAGKVVGTRLDGAADRKVVEDYLATLGKSQESHG
ncbi:MAG TPA: F0F1 ATP synthase subunit B [Gemmatimonadales bacterium]|jgi:F-type H+-transporting ATPase subunit b|nr:F0F1 ATP synthase subunit B [Gemmatimonadales bacterium]